MRRAVAFVLLGCWPVFGFDAGFDFRTSAGFVTDPVYATFAAMGTTSYPTTAAINGQMVTFGWESVGGNNQTRDRAASGDPRIAGMNCHINDGTMAVFRVDLPSAGQYQIGIAGGDPGGYTQVNYLTVSDTTASVLSLHQVTGAGSTVDFVDASGAVLSWTNWSGSNPLVQKRFGTTILRLTLGGTADASFSCIAHLRIVSAQTAAAQAAARSFFIQ